MACRAIEHYHSRREQSSLDCGTADPAGGWCIPADLYHFADSADRWAGTPAVTIEENPRFIKVMDLASIEDFNLSSEEIDSIKWFVSHNWRLIEKLGSTTDPAQDDFVDASDFARRAILP